LPFFHYILPCSFFLFSSSIFFFSPPNLSGHRLDVYHTSTYNVFSATLNPTHFTSLPYFYTWHGPSANLECRSEMCCTRLAANAGPKKVA